jgi:hypothetical protein
VVRALVSSAVDVVPWVDDVGLRPPMRRALEVPS